jgi:selenocysteine-specific elongation factor
MVAMQHDLILGTAGHIDHGKTSLIRALTGVDTDRLPEEKRRGITIELGFAELVVGSYRLGIVDVPGHERFIRQMLAGATGMDLAMLVVAADDSVKPQTREHLDVLRMLSLKSGVIALTKTDLADPDWIALVEEEVREAVRGTCFEAAPIVRTSAVTGVGIEQLKESLRHAAATVTEQAAQRISLPFRMAIDRTFTVAGHGTVVTGSVSAGRVGVGDTLVVEPGHISVRVRALHNHDREVTTVHAGQRAAMNLAGIRHDEVRRGHELTAVGEFTPSRLLTVTLSVLPAAPRPLRSRDRVRMHLGTAEVLATVVLLQDDAILPGASGTAQLFLREAVMASWNQPFVLRSESPVATIAGGRILVAAASKLRKPDTAVLEKLADMQSNEPGRRAAAAAYFLSPSAWDPSCWTWTAGISAPDEMLANLLKQKQLLGVAVSAQRRLYLHVDRLAEYANRAQRVLARWHDRNPLQSMFDCSSLAQQFRYLGDDALFEEVLRYLERQGIVRRTARAVGLVERSPQLSKNEQVLLHQLVGMFLSAGLQPPSLAECEQAAAKHRKSVRPLVNLAVSDGELIEVGNGIYLHTEVEERLRDQLRTAFDGQQEMTVSELKDVVGTTRKYAVPICEYLDRIGFTLRVGDRRRLSDSVRKATV